VLHTGGHGEQGAQTQKGNHDGIFFRDPFGYD